MARRDFLPITDAGLLAWTANFARLINETPTEYGLTLAAAGDYQAKQELFAARLTASTDPETRGKRTVFLKKEAKQTLITLTRKIARQIKNMVSVTDDQRQALGLPVFNTHRTPKPAPTQSPFLKVVNIDGRRVTVELWQDAHRRAKPEDAVGATLFTTTNPNATSSDDFSFVTSTTKTKVTIPFPPSATGDTVYLSAFWRNSTDASGPACQPVRVNLPAGGSLPSVAKASPTLKAA